MAERTWFFAAEGKQQGPYPEQQFRELLASSTITADTLVWSEGLSSWQRAGDVPGLAPRATGQAAAGGAITGDFTTWGLFGRVLLFVIGFLLVIPAPWVATILYRWLVEHLRVPRRPNLGFTGNPGDIWYVFVLMGLISYAGFTGIWWLPFIFMPVNAFLAWLSVRWVAANISSDGQKLAVTFEGSPWAYIGWFVLAYVSIFTVVGWAWVATAWTRWICRNIAGTRRTVVFNASGWGVLWRTVLFVLACIPIIPVPWVMGWFARWYASQFELVERAS
jgi:GYF domain 2